MSCTLYAALALTLCVSQPPFEANPDKEDPEPGQVLQLTPRPVKGMVAAFETFEDETIARISGHLGVQIAWRKGSCQFVDHEDYMMVSLRVVVDGVVVPGTYSTENVGRRRHYRDIPFYVVVPLEPGRHSVQIHAHAARKGGQDAHDCDAYVKQRQFSRLQIEVME
jgi:hypothetical protein